MTVNKLPLLLLAFCFSANCLAKNNEDSMLASEQVAAMEIDFSEPNEIERWRSTNDGVMGGLSAGSLRFDDDSGIFSGVISLENNGGFSSVNRAIKPLPAEQDTVEIDISGDGATYQLRLMTLVNGYRLHYKHEFDTSLGKREKVTFNLRDFKASYHGRLVRGAPKLRSENIKRIGFLLSKKQQGPFSLSLYRFSVYQQSRGQ